MRIKTRQRINVIITIVLSVTVSAILAVTVRLINEKYREARIAATIVKEVAETKIITSEYLLHGGERTKTQWQLKYDSLTRLLKEEEFKETELEIIVDKMLHNHERIKTVFLQLTALSEKGQEFSKEKNFSNQELEDRLVDLLLVNSQEMVSAAFNLQHRIEEDVKTTLQRSTYLIRIFVVFLAGFFIATSLWTNRSIVAPIAKLEADIQVIGAGNLEYKLGTAAKDEIGQLSRAFDKMTEDLQKTTTSITKLNKEISERKRLEKQLLIRQRMDFLGTLGGGIAHDFNNLLAGIMGYLDILLNINNEGLNVTQREYIENALKSCNRAADLVKQFQSLSRGSISKKTSVDLYKASKEVFSLLEKTTDKLIEKKIDLQPEEFYVTANPSELNQVLLNLGTNAVRAIEERGVKPGNYISIRAKEYFVTAGDKTGVNEGEYVHIFFEDNGAGMSDEVKKQAFDPLFTTRGKGTQKGQGLGLAMVFNIVVRNHKGYIDIESVEGKGTTMHVYLPKAQLPEQAEDEEVIRVVGGNETILIIDDEEMIINFVKNVLGNYGYNILAARDGKQGLDVYTENKDSIDLVLLDLTMPEMSGRMVFEEMLKNNPAIKVIISSGHSEEDTSRGIFSRAKAWVSKPYKVTALAQSIRTVLDS